MSEISNYNSSFDISDFIFNLEISNQLSGDDCMKESKIKIFLLIIVSLIVLTILFSNIGQNFKGNISSYDDTIKYYNTMKTISNKSKSYQNFINSNANYLTRVIRANKFEPLIENKFIDKWNLNTPALAFTSTLEIFDNNNKIIKKYRPGIDFFEDYRGNTTTGIVKSKATYAPNMDSIHNVLSEVVLFNGYGEYSTNEELSLVDIKLKSLGASGIISPINTTNAILESGYNKHDLIATKTTRGIAKFLATKSVFNQLIDYSKLGYTIKIKSGGEVLPIEYKNVYGVIKGTNPNYKPLIIGVFYDGPYKANPTKFVTSRNYFLPASLVLDCSRVVYKQRLRKPDRNIIFAFLSGYSRDKEGLKHFLASSPNGNILFFDGIGLTNKFSLVYSKSAATLCSSLTYFMKNDNYNITNKTKDKDSTNHIVLITADNLAKLKEIKAPNYIRSNNASHFILAFIQDECYNLNILTGNVRAFRAFERFIRNNSAALSIVAIIFLVFVLFFPIKKKNSSKQE